ncbi:hypothetical protein JOQ06_000880, partial [Pogonophryne albipinna]
MEIGLIYSCPSSICPFVLRDVLSVSPAWELIGPDFTETYYTEDGQPVTVSNNNYTDHCFYHGHVRGHPESWVALSTCSGI